MIGYMDFQISSCKFDETNLKTLSHTSKAKFLNLWESVKRFLVQFSSVQDDSSKAIHIHRAAFGELLRLEFTIIEWEALMLTAENA